MAFCHVTRWRMCVLCPTTLHSHVDDAPASGSPNIHAPRIQCIIGMIMLSFWLFSFGVEGTNGHSYYIGKLGEYRDISEGKLLLVWLLSFPLTLPQVYFRLVLFFTIAPYHCLPQVSPANHTHTSLYIKYSVDKNSS